MKIQINNDKSDKMEEKFKKVQESIKLYKEAKALLKKGDSDALKKIKAKALEKADNYFEAKNYLQAANKYQSISILEKPFLSSKFQTLLKNDIKHITYKKLKKIAQKLGIKGESFNKIIEQHDKNDQIKVKKFVQEKLQKYNESEAKVIIEKMVDEARTSGFFSSKNLDFITKETKEYINAVNRLGQYPTPTKMQHSDQSSDSDDSSASDSSRDSDNKANYYRSNSFNEQLDNKDDPILKSILKTSTVPEEIMRAYQQQSLAFQPDKGVDQLRNEQRRDHKQKEIDTLIKQVTQKFQEVDRAKIGLLPPKPVLEVLKTNPHYLESAVQKDKGSIQNPSDQLGNRWFRGEDMTYLDVMFRNNHFDYTTNTNLILSNIQDSSTIIQNQINMGRPYFAAFCHGGTNSGTEDGSHWVAICIVKHKGKVKLLYKDSFGNPIPMELQYAFNSAFGKEKLEFISNSNIEQYDGYNCGPMTLTNLLIIAQELSSDYRDDFIHKFSSFQGFCNTQQAHSLFDEVVNYPIITDETYLIGENYSNTNNEGLSGKRGRALRAMRYMIE